MRAAAIGLLVLVAACGRAATKTRADTETEAAAAELSSVAPDPACDQVVSFLTGYVVDPGWSIVTRNTLLSSDAELWAEYHAAALCPGVAESDLDGDDLSEFAVTEIRRSGDQLEQRMRVYRPSRGTTEEVWPASDVPFAYVVYSTTDREARDFYTGEVTRIPHGSFAYVRMEAWAEVYFEVEGQLRHVLVSD